jgi:hypothetical protein
MGIPGSSWPSWEVSKELNGIRHVGYQFYSDFCTENESRVAKSLRFLIRLPQGGPWGSKDPGALFLEFPRNFMIHGMFDINPTQFSALKMNTGLPNVYDLKSGSLGLPVG